MRILFVVIFLFLSPIVSGQGNKPVAAPACSVPESTVEANNKGFAFHFKRRLEEASEAYDEVLRLAPPRAPDAGERAIIRKHAPRLFLVEGEPFPLKDIAAVLHPERPWIAYHLFWDDDIDFPDDNDPCDHEVVWVQLDTSKSKVVGYFSYFHGRIVTAPKDAIADANSNGGRPAFWVQWGKHGSMPVGWQELESANRADFQRLNSEGRYRQTSPLGKGWPLRFSGSWEDFTRFNQPLNTVPLLETKGLEIVSYFSNAVINRYFLRYNFAAKTEWPESICRQGE